jgi:hypothetical protein
MSNETLRTYGPNQKWRSYVSGSIVENYSVAESIWSNAKSARQKLGREQKMPSEYTTLSQPIWSSNNISITKWAQAVVSYGAKQKLIVKFNCILNSFTNRLQIMD